MSYIQSFSRYEIKYLLTPLQRERFMSRASMLSPDEYGSYTICNIYLDTDDFYFITHSLDKPVYKEKLRIRSYGTASSDSEIFFEIKKKFKGIVYKRRIVVPISEAMAYISEGVVPQSLSGYKSMQIFNEIDFLMKKYDPSPKLYLAYDREAFSADGGIRVTLDRNIRSRWSDLSLSSDSGTELLDTGVDDYSLMEIKCPAAFPSELAAVLSELEIYPTSFSKYGQIYKSSAAARKTKAFLT